MSRVIDDSWHELNARAEILERRRDAGFVRQCHGDLHLRNIVLLDGRPTLFDGVEFNDEISCTDVLYDLAFLLMDLWRRKLPRHANAVLNGYLTHAGEWDGLALLPLFLSCRAAVRAKTSATAAAQVLDEEARRGELHATAREYLAMAERLLHPPPPCLVAVGGLSGSGKSTLALGVAPAIGGAPGAVVLRSDETRKQLARRPRPRAPRSAGLLGRHVPSRLYHCGRARRACARVAGIVLSSMPCLRSRQIESRSSRWPPRQASPSLVSGSTRLRPC